MTAPNHLPSVSCCMPTYGKSAKLLNESVQCFLDQDYAGVKELVIYNDYKNVQFEFDHPEVRIVNSAEREPNFGAKYNATVALARNEYIFLWDDDDIFLPHRITYSLANMRNDVFRSGRNYLLNGQAEHLELFYSVCPSSVCIKKSVYMEMGGFDQKEEAVDVDFIKKLDVISGGYTHMPIEDIYYIYRWNPAANYHHSAIAARANGDEFVQGLIDDAISTEIRGRQTITPTYYRDYRQLKIKSE